MHCAVRPCPGPLHVSCPPSFVHRTAYILYTAGVTIGSVRWQARLERLESGLYTGASGRSGKAYLSAQDPGTPASSGNKGSAKSLKRLGEDQVDISPHTQMILPCRLIGAEPKVIKIDRERMRMAGKRMEVGESAHAAGQGCPPAGVQGPARAPAGV
jgi:hypothetical protein